MPEFAAIKEAAERLRPAMSRFLRDLIRIPGQSCREKEVVARIAEEMRRVGFDSVTVDAMGNVLGSLGSGETLIAFDAHIDTVGVGSRANWTFDPYEGMEDDEAIGGLGASDQLGGVVSAVYGAKIIKDLGLLSATQTILVTGTVQEEDCDGLCWQYLIEQSNIRPALVVLTEPTDHGIYRGHRGRMEIRVAVGGISCHGSAPERGDNAIYKMADILQELRALNGKLRHDAFLGKGTLAVSEIFSSSPSRCAVADGCSVSIDRRLTFGETAASAVAEITALPSVKKHGAAVSVYRYGRPSYTGLIYPTECIFPAWAIAEDHPAVRAMADAHNALYGGAAIGKWTFSTNGVAIMGRHAIPCVGFGPGKEAQAHAPDEKTWKDDLVRCAAVYAALPGMYARQA